LACEWTHQDQYADMPWSVSLPHINHVAFQLKRQLSNTTYLFKITHFIFLYTSQRNWH